MSRTTNIEWTQHTWNPFVGCSIQSKGCKNCYAMLMAKRLEAMNVSQYKGTTKTVNGNTVWTGVINRNSINAFNKPLNTKKPSVFFVNSMSDFFHDNANLDDQLDALKLMSECKQHVFQILTKRPDNIADVMSLIDFDTSNVMIGVSVECSKTVDRIEVLKDSYDGVKFISFEPLIECVGDISLIGIDWAISGGESGFKCRPCDNEWITNIDNTCKRDNVPHFFKQFGHHSNNPLLLDKPDGISDSEYIKQVDPIGKGGSLLNGIYVKDFPELMKTYSIASDSQSSLLQS